MNLPPDPMRARLDSGELVLCLGISQARTVDIPMIAAACGFDAISVDLEHTATSLETTAMLCSAAIGFGLTPMVRVPSHDHQYMTRVLDTGAVGVTVPHVDTRAQAERIVELGKFPPIGGRSVHTMSPVNRYRSLPVTEILEFINSRTILTAMLETPEAVERADDIAAVEGLDMILLGPYDLTAEMGILGQFRHPDFRKAVEAVASACRRQNKIFGIAGIPDPELLTEYIALGLRFINAGNDAAYFMQAARAHVASLRKLPVS
jgi:2-keto-3-deoxy-L-rhamnonate aldolase RhmA